MEAGRRQLFGMRLRSGIKLLDEREGSGEPAKTGDRIIYNLKIYLNKGEEVPINARQAEHLPEKMIRVEEDGHHWVDHSITLGQRQAMAGVEYSLVGMKQGGYRKVRVSPHLAYRATGIDGLIPPDAVLVVELWLRELIRI
jgi:FKBP-type peptidyl-prolyl cis-trans isomerase (trigger factor)